MGTALTEPRRIYEQLWRKTGPLLKSGQVRIDPYLRDRAGDDRRGATLVTLPDAGVRRRVGKFLREAAALCPRQHFYTAVGITCDGDGGHCRVGILARRNSPVAGLPGGVGQGCEEMPPVPG